MKNLINFLIHHSGLLLFIILEIISFIMMINSQEYQKSIFLSSSNAVVATLYNWTNSVGEFFKLRNTNNQLSSENTELKNQIIELQNKLKVLEPSITSLNFKLLPENEYRFISAKVINNSTDKFQNYLTLNKGSKDGVKPDMGVVSSEGVVGIIKSVSPRFSVVIPILNPKIQISCKFKRTDYTGSLVWNGEDYRYANLVDIARHVDIRLGDTIVTSGFTRTFPEGIPVGIVEDYSIKESDAYYNIKVKLAVNFRTLTYVNIIDYLNYQEQKQLEEKNYE
ncbi:MAG TPA: rod shape-determining protein MreC [Paludibacteraceae bacterium]|nr:rod shape-determining protein MreC [Paludibacteraceae bacterium]HPO67769.1 rod shape-determining protein MreC [Paludibacteraceae bacterium]